MSDNYPLAQEALKRGWAVFPCGPDKKPLTPHGFKDATQDAQKVFDFWERWPDAILGIPCKINNIWALDLDRKNGADGIANFQKLAKKHGAESVQVGPMQNTPSGGLHLLFRLPADVVIQQSAGKLAPGIDVRSAGYICTGSLPDGRAYLWNSAEGHGMDAPITDAPNWLIDLLAVKVEAPQAEAPRPAPARGDLDKIYRKWLSRAQPGNRNHNGFDLACQCRDAGISEAETLALPYPEEAPAGDHPYPREEWTLSVKSAYSGTPRPSARSPNEPPAPREAQQSKPEQSMTEAPLTCATWADLSNAPIEFIWKPWLAKGFLSLLVSRSGDGKSLLALRLCGCFLMGLPWPDGTPFEGEQGSVLWVEAEAAQALNRSRAQEWGYPLNKIITPFDDPLQDANLDDLNHRKIIEARASLPEVKFIVIDSLSGGSRKRENDTEIKDVTLWAAKLARDLNKPDLLNHHLGKKKEWDTAEISLDRVRGSSSIVQFARIVWALSVPDPTNKECKRLEQIKNNLTRFPEAVGMTAGENGINFGAAPTAPHVETSSDRVADLLLSLLKAGPVKATDIEAELDGAGLSMVTAKRNKDRLGIVSFRKGTAWYWALPARQAE